jgi:hypothetical protein
MEIFKMVKKIDLKKILKKNSHISKEALDNSMALSEELRKMGFKPRGYQLAMPFERRYNKIED